MDKFYNVSSFLDNSIITIHCTFTVGRIFLSTIISQLLQRVNSLDKWYIMRRLLTNQCCRWQSGDCWLDEQTPSSKISDEANTHAQHPSCKNFSWNIMSKCKMVDLISILKKDTVVQVFCIQAKLQFGSQRQGNQWWVTCKGYRGFLAIMLMSLVRLP